MVKKKRLWWRAGALAAPERSAGWSDALWRGAELVEVRWEDDEGAADSYAVHGLQALALLLLSAADEHAGRVNDVPETEIRATVGDPVHAAVMVTGFVASHAVVPGYEWRAPLAMGVPSRQRRLSVPTSSGLTSATGIVPRSVTSEVWTVAGAERAAA